MNFCMKKYLFKKRYYYFFEKKNKLNVVLLFSFFLVYEIIQSLCTQIYPVFLQFLGQKQENIYLLIV